jgi:hypothetical protein
MLNFKVVLITNRHHEPGPPIRRDGDYKAKFTPESLPSVQPSRVQPSRQSAGGLRSGNVHMLDTELECHHHYPKLAKTMRLHAHTPMKIVEIIDKNVFVGDLPYNATEYPNGVVFKLFPEDSAKMITEMRSYEALHGLQGSVIPECIGVFTIDGFDGCALGFHAMSGITLQKHFEIEEPNVENLDLFRSIWRKIEQIHDCDVVHGDVRPENIWITGNGDVFIFDFDHAL